MNYNSSTISRIADIVLGIRVDRSAAAIAAGTNPIFTVTGGRVALLGLLGEVVTTMDATLTTLQINANPTTGDDTVLCAASASIANVDVGCMFTLPDVVGTALVTSTTDGGCILSTAPRWAIRPGSIELITGVGANAGTMKWSLWYVPIDDGAYVSAA